MTNLYTTDRRSHIACVCYQFAIRVWNQHRQTEIKKLEKE